MCHVKMFEVIKNGIQTMTSRLYTMIKPHTTLLSGNSRKFVFQSWEAREYEE